MNKKMMTGLAFLRKMMLAAVLSSSILVISCGDSDGSPKLKDSEEKTIYETTKGTVTEVEEIEPGDDYKIIDERIIDKKENSIAIVHGLNGQIDTLSLAKIDNGSEENGYRNRSGLRSILYYSLASSFFNRNLSNVSPNSGYYKDASAYNKSTGLKNDLTNSATSRKVRVPGTSSKGYGSGKSFRSFGG
ncbi:MULTISPECIES: hypothetical protein [Cellulophaga]|jgi:hypothetical protein|nr:MULTISPECIES: hypothetical protein [Cellulophaga]AIY13759.1 hypothetical protein M667_11350 [Cellulophaga baltica NN016038]MBA6314895.1 hypothetical protein [Cellulophaga baltica]QXP52269.1 hypothetical protein H0I24_19450 [Cellulophaga sp. HaHa_2_1]QXP55408.1 hypothetical protein H0I25_15220 [Cellulophaga sp. HaHa_2_95]